MAVNRPTLELIREYEGFVPNWYPDPAHGWKVPTCCIGHTDAAGEPKYAATKAKKFSEEEGLIILRRDLKSVEEQVRSLVKVPLNENQFGALVSFTFNVGVGNFGKSTLLKKLNRGDYAGAAAEFNRWINAAGKPLPGLVRRRQAERVLFLTDGLHPLPAPSDPTPPSTPAAPKKSLWAAFLAWLKGLFNRKD